MDVFGQRLCVFRKKWHYSVKSACIPGKICCYSSIIGCIPVKWLYSGKSCCLFRRKMNVLRAKVVVFGANEIVLG